MQPLGLSTGAAAGDLRREVAAADDDAAAPEPRSLVWRRSVVSSTSRVHWRRLGPKGTLARTMSAVMSPPALLLSFAWRRTNNKQPLASAVQQCAGLPPPTPTYRARVQGQGITEHQDGACVTLQLRVGDQTLGTAWGSGWSNRATTVSRHFFIQACVCLACQVPVSLLRSIKPPRVGWPSAEPSAEWSAPRDCCSIANCANEAALSARPPRALWRCRSLTPAPPAPAPAGAPRSSCGGSGGGAATMPRCSTDATCPGLAPARTHTASCRHKPHSNLSIVLPIT